MRTAADLADLRGDGDRGERAAHRSQALLPAVIARYRPGTGVFTAGQPDGTQLPVRHCYDFSVVGTTIAEDLARESATGWSASSSASFRPTTGCALSPWDPRRQLQPRARPPVERRHPAWPADAGRALSALGAPKC
ncbi:hypothetical protein JM654_23685 [Microbacterium oxydans]|nr:hypothetical protein [Microbacterium oxydans]